MTRFMTRFIIQVLSADLRAIVREELELRDGLQTRVLELEADLTATRSVVESFAARIADQSELLAKRAERNGVA